MPTSPGVKEASTIHVPEEPGALVSPEEFGFADVCLALSIPLVLMGIVTGLFWEYRQ